MIVSHQTAKGKIIIGVELPSTLGFYGTGATGIEPATFGFGDRRSVNQGQGLRGSWGQNGDGPDTRNMEDAMVTACTCRHGFILNCPEHGGQPPYPGPPETPNRWAAFTDDELAELADDFDPALGIGARSAREGSTMAELVAEIERRKT